MPRPESLTVLGPFCEAERQFLGAVFPSVLKGLTLLLVLQDSRPSLLFPASSGVHRALLGTTGQGWIGGHSLYELPSVLHRPSGGTRSSSLSWFLSGARTLHKTDTLFLSIRAAPWVRDSWGNVFETCCLLSSGVWVNAGGRGVAHASLQVAVLSTQSLPVLIPKCCLEKRLHILFFQPKMVSSLTSSGIGLV